MAAEAGLGPDKQRDYCWLLSSGWPFAAARGGGGGAFSVRRTSVVGVATQSANSIKDGEISHSFIQPPPRDSHATSGPPRPPLTPDTRPRDVSHDHPLPRSTIPGSSPWTSGSSWRAWVLDSNPNLLGLAVVTRRGRRSDSAHMAKVVGSEAAERRRPLTS